MFDISKYLEKFTIMSQSRHYLRDSVAEAIKNVCKIEIDPKTIEIKEGIVRINTKPIIKSEVFLKKNKIIGYLNSEKKIKIHDIL